MRQFSLIFTKDPFVHKQFRESNSHRIVLTWSFTESITVRATCARARSVASNFDRRVLLRDVSRPCRRHFLAADAFEVELQHSRHSPPARSSIQWWADDEAPSAPVRSGWWRRLLVAASSHPASGVLVA